MTSKHKVETTAQQVGNENIVFSESLDVYANSIRLGITLSDFTIIFSAIEDRGAAPAGIKDKAIIRLAPSTAKQLLLQLQDTLTAYEQAVGTIPVASKFKKSSPELQEKVIAALKNVIS